MQLSYRVPLKYNNYQEKHVRPISGYSSSFSEYDREITAFETKHQQEKLTSENHRCTFAREVENANPIAASEKKEENILIYLALRPRLYRSRHTGVRHSLM